MTAFIAFLQHHKNKKISLLHPNKEKLSYRNFTNHLITKVNFYRSGQHSFWQTLQRRFIPESSGCLRTRYRPQSLTWRRSGESSLFVKK